jgi:hypothetical protein
MRAAYTMLNTVVVSPIPTVSARTATAVNVGVLRSERAAWRSSRGSAGMGGGPTAVEVVRLASPTATAGAGFGPRA